MTIGVLGASGQLGRQLMALASKQCIGDVLAVSRQQVDLSIPESIVEQLDSLPELQVIINAAAYTGVDKAESESEIAAAINHHAVTEIARYCEQKNILFIHVSTDFVFDGIFTGSSPSAYRTDSNLSPLGVYGATKAAGEQAALSLCSKAFVVRTSWVYGEFGSNFVKTMLRLAADRSQLNVVVDQIGAPTYAANLANCIWSLVKKQLDALECKGHSDQRIYHYSDAGVASWYDFAIAIFEEAHKLGLCDHPPSVHPILSDQYPTPAKRPAFSLLSTGSTITRLEVLQPHWRKALRVMLQRLSSDLHS